MYNQIEQFIDSAFAGVPVSERAQQLRNRLRDETFARYDRFIAEGKSEQAAFSLAVAGIGDISGIIRTVSAEPNETLQSPEEKRKEAKRSGILLAAAVMLYILCPIPVIILGDTRFDVLSVCLLLAMVAAATGIIIYRAQTSFHRNSSDGSDSNKEKNADSRFTPVQRTILSFLGPLTLIIYLIVSFTTHAWYITWIVFPLFGIAGEIVRLCFDAANENNPNISKATNATGVAIAKIIGLVITAAVLISLLVLVPKISGLTSWKNLFSDLIAENASVVYDNESSYSIGDGEVDAGEITEVEINWVGGKVSVDAGQGEKITFSENDVNSSNSQMRYLVSGKKLIIQPYKSGSTQSGNKNLTVVLPKELAELSMDVVNADVTLSGIAAESLSYENVSGDLDIKGSQISFCDTETVSGDINFSGVCPTRFDAETVSGDITLSLDDCSGFTISLSSISGRTYSEYECDEDDDDIIYGNGECRMNISSVSGDLNILKAE